LDDEEKNLSDEFKQNDNDNDNDNDSHEEIVEKAPKKRLVKHKLKAKKWKPSFDGGKMKDTFSDKELHDKKVRSAVK
tara:strand:+ start:381 stop:611 length:231 start_codon:yes stop_codon:yes gene_type:complete